MLSNLVSNAIRYNLKKNGYLRVKVKGSAIRLENPGKHLTKNTEDLFDRFARDNDNPDSLGLGLSIVKLICEYSGLMVDYYHKEGIHELVVRKK